MRCTPMSTTIYMYNGIFCQTLEPGGTSLTHLPIVHARGGGPTDRLQAGFLSNLDSANADTKNSVAVLPIV